MQADLQRSEAPCGVCTAIAQSLQPGSTRATRTPICPLGQMQGNRKCATCQAVCDALRAHLNFGKTDHETSLISTDHNDGPIQRTSICLWDEQRSEDATGIDPREAWFYMLPNAAVELDTWTDTQQINKASVTSDMIDLSLIKSWILGCDI